MKHNFLFIITVVLMMVGPVSATWLNTTVYYDGHVGEDTNSAWSTMRGAAGDIVTASPTTIYVYTHATTTSNVYDYNYRGLLTFSTSSISDTATINSATLTFYGRAGKEEGLGTSGLSLIAASPANPTSYAAGDYDGTTFARQATDIAFASFPDDNWATFTLNSTGISSISKTGYTTFALAHSKDTDNSALTWASDAYTGFEVRGKSYSSGVNAAYMNISYTESLSDPYAGYIPPSITGDAPLSVTFTNISAGTPTAYNWSFKDVTGNNTEVWFNTSANPIKIFNAGNFSIRLNASNADGYNITPENQMFVNVSGASVPVTDFSCALTEAVVNSSIYCSDTSTNTPTIWTWKTDNNPALTGTSADFYIEWNNVGVWDIYHYSANSAGGDWENKTNYINITATPPVLPVSNFTANQTVIIAGEGVQFIDASLYATSWLWTIDGHTFTDQNPEYAFTTPGTYSIILQATNAGGSNTFTRTNYITVSSGEWTYSTPGSYTWQCPPTVTSVILNIAAGGGSGHGGWSSGGYRYAGYGGSPGEYVNVSAVTIPGQNYTIVVGAGGATALYGASSNDGSVSSGIGQYKSGGLGGLTLPVMSPTGGNAVNTNFMSTSRLSVNGSAGNFGSGGTGGTGYGAGGGGGGSDGALASTGGAGAGGYVRITAMSAAGANIPDFTAYPLTGGSGLYVTFTDTSVIRDTANLTYLWDFGDGTSSTTVGSVPHVYSYLGTYTVNLTLSSDLGDFTKTRGEYISITKTDTATTWYSQKLVRLTVVDGYGTALEGATVNVSYIATSLPSTDVSWLQSAFGISPAVVTEMLNGSVVMSANTGSDGAVAMMMFPAIQYGITITNATIGLSKYVAVYPSDSEYTIRCDLISQAAPVSAATHLANSTIYVTEPNASYVTFNIVYQDISDRTTNIKWNVTCLTNNTVVYSKDFGDPGLTIKTDNYTVPTEPRGTEFRAMYDATRSW